MGMVLALTYYDKGTTSLRAKRGVVAWLAPVIPDLIRNLPGLALSPRFFYITPP